MEDDPFLENGRWPSFFLEWKTTYIFFNERQPKKDNVIKIIKSKNNGYGTAPGNLVEHPFVGLLGLNIKSFHSHSYAWTDNTSGCHWVVFYAMIS